MQQFTVPQFIDVESKIIGPITTRQFLILLGAAVIVGISYRLFDFSLFLTIAIVVVIIAALFSFVKINGRPFHFFVLNLVQTWRRPGMRVWSHSGSMTVDEPLADSVTKAPRPVAKEPYQVSRLSELALIVDTKGKYKGE